MRGQKKAREAEAPLKFFLTKSLNKTYIPKVSPVQLNQCKNHVAFWLRFFLNSICRSVSNPFNHFLFSSPIRRFIYSSTLSSVIEVPPKAAKKRSIKIVTKIAKKNHSQGLITNSPPNLYVLHFQ